MFVNADLITSVVKVNEPGHACALITMGADELEVRCSAEEVMNSIMNGGGVK